MQYLWQPTPERIENANIIRFMRAQGIEVDSSNLEQVEQLTRSFVARSQQDLEWFWPAALDDLGIGWTQPYQQLLDNSRGNPWTDWFINGETNIALNCLDRHAVGPRADELALIGETENGQVRRFTFAEASAEVNRVANALLELGIGRGDTVACYMPMVAEVVFAMMAVQKMGAIFVPIFSGYAAPAVRERLEDAEVKLLFTADGSMRRGKPFSIKENADLAVEGLDTVQAVVVLQRIGESLECPMRTERDHWWHQIVERQSADCASVSMPAMAPALMIYTSGTTGKPKGTIHTHAGCLAQMGKELAYNFDVKAGDVFWWFSDIGWMMGPWQIIGCWQHGVAMVVFEGAPNFPEPDRVWQMVEQHQVTHLGISPTAIRLLMRSGDAWVDKHPMPSLHTLGSTGEPWDPESYQWFYQKVGGGRCPIINISGGTDIVGCFMAPLPVMPISATSLQSAGLGMAIDVFDEQGQSLVGEVGYLVCRKPAPSMTRSLWKNDEKYIETYWSKFDQVWNHGDWAKVDADGQWYLFGRADDTLKVAGRRVGPGEIEAAILDHEAASEAAVVGVPCDLKGTDIVCFVVLGDGVEESESLREQLVQQIVAALGKVDRPQAVLFVDDLPKTRSAKILRRLIKRQYLGEAIADLSSVANPTALAAISAAR